MNRFISHIREIINLMNGISCEVNLGLLAFLLVDNTSYGTRAMTDDTHLLIF